MKQLEEFETEFEKYTEQRDFAASEGALMTIIRNAFFAGWKAAKSPRPQAEAENLLNVACRRRAPKVSD